MMLGALKGLPPLKLLHSLLIPEILPLMFTSITKVSSVVREKREERMNGRERGRERDMLE